MILGSKTPDVKKRFVDYILSITLPGENSCYMERTVVQYLYEIRYEDFNDANGE
jgi:hypothetical protein